MPVRQREHEARVHAVAFRRWSDRIGLSGDDAARQIGVAPGTLADWQRRWKADHLDPSPLGRPCRRPDRATRNAVVDLLRATGPALGLPALRAAFPEVARGELLNLQGRFRRVCAKDNQRLLYCLHWHRPGAVWAMDHAEAVEPIDGLYPHLLAVRDLASGITLLWLPVPAPDADSTVAALHALFRQFGPPLVLKSDNGSAFTAGVTRRFLARWQVCPLFSPPYMPRYNGACEAGIGALKTRTHYQAASAGHPARWTADDTEAARRVANELHYPDNHPTCTPNQLWLARQPITVDERAAFGHSLRQHRDLACNQEQQPYFEDLGPAAQAHTDRIALRRALVELGFLSFTRRYITPPLHSQKSPNIS